MILQLVWWLLSLLSLTLLLLYGFYIRRHSRAVCNMKRSVNSLRLCAVAGSGGHTAELLSVMNAFEKQFGDRVYLVAKTDELSEQKILKFEQSQIEGNFRVQRISRSREVKQSYTTAVFTTIWACIECLFLMWKIRPDLLLCNGPGVCIPVCFCAALLDLLRLCDVRIFYVESICRVKKLSLAGQILYQTRITDLFFVHWQDLVVQYPRTILVPYNRDA